MDDYISKPIDLQLLSSLLGKWLPHPDDDLEMLEAQEASASEGVPVFDRESFMNRISGDKEFARQIIETYLEDMPVQLDALVQAIGEGDAEKSANFAHRIKGASANVSCEELHETAGLMEDAGRAGNIDALKNSLSIIQQQFADAKETLTLMEFMPQVNS